MTSNSKSLYCGLAVWSILGGLTLLGDAVLPAHISALFSPFVHAPTWTTGVNSLFYLTGGIALLITLFWRNRNIQPALMIGQIAWILIATGAIATALICISYEQRMFIMVAWTLVLAAVAIWEWVALLRVERKAHARRHRRQVMEALA